MAVGRRNLGVQDTEFLEHDSRIQAMQKNHDRTNRWINQEIQDERFTDAVTDIDKQLGRWMDRETFRKLVEGLSSKLKVDYHPRLPTLAVHEVKEAMPWERDPTTGRLGGLQKVFKMGVGSLNTPIVPEWSLLEAKKSRNPYGETVKIPNKVVAHGWRRALAILVKQGFVPLWRVEQIIDKYGSPSAESASWQTLMGYRKKQGREFVY